MIHALGNNYMARKQYGIVTGCKKLSIRRDPDPDTEMDDWFEQIHNPTEIVCEVKAGDRLQVDTSKVVYDAWGRGFYKVKTDDDKEGYAPTGAVRLITKGGSG